MQRRLKLGLRYLGLAMLAVLLVVAWAWVCGALHFVFRLPSLLALALIPALPATWIRWRSEHRRLLKIQAAITVAVIVLLLLILRPSNDRQWVDEYRIQPTAKIDESSGTVNIEGLRDFSWRTREDHTASWDNRSYQLGSLNALDLIIEPLGDSNHFAHSMLSFGFEGGERVVISVEIRREEGEKFGLLPGLYGQFELMYQVLDERDALTVRALAPDSHLYIYPVDATPKFIRDLFLDMLREANSLGDKPRFYHSLRANCTTKLFDHMNEVIDQPIRYRKEVLFPSMAGKLLAEMGWLKSELPYEETKQRVRATDRVREFADDPDFSQKIRPNSPG